MIEFFIPGVPYAKQSARFTRTGAVYQTKNVKAWRLDVSLAALQNREEVFTGSIRVRLDFSLKHDADVDNLAKAVLDGLQGVLFDNDRDVIDLHVTKRKSKPYGVMVRIEVA